TSNTAKAARRDEDVEIVEHTVSGYICNIDGCRLGFYNLPIRALHIRAEHRAAAARLFPDPKQQAGTGAGAGGDDSLSCPFPKCSETFQKHFQVARHKWQHIPDRYRPRCLGTVKESGGRQACDYLYAGRADLMRGHWKVHHAHEGQYPAPEYESFERCLAKAKADKRRKKRGRDVSNKKMPITISPSPSPSDSSSLHSHATTTTTSSTITISPSATTTSTNSGTSTASGMPVALPLAQDGEGGQIVVPYFEGISLPEQALSFDNPWMGAWGLGMGAPQKEVEVIEPGLGPSEFQVMDWSY
ncbi:hypothetical protein FRC17_010262, partial [Serendipita sp. 399]